MGAPEMRLTNVNGIDLELFDGGGEGDPVLFLHSTRDDWHAVLEQPTLSENHRVILFHRRGCGGSTRKGLPATFADHAADGRAVLRHLGVERAHVAGLSIGAAMVLQMAKDYPDAVHSMVLLEPALLGPISNYPHVHEAIVEAQSLYESGDKEGALRVHLGELCGPNAWDIFTRETLARLIEDADALYQSDGPALAQWDYSENDARGLTQPVLNMTGANTRPYYKDVHETVKQWFPHGENVVIPDAQHPIPSMQPTRVAEHMAEFFSRHPIQP